MIGSCDFSDTDDSAVEEIISQAQDACVLEQLAAINCSGVTDTVLPSHLETRFRNLKSFPPSKPKPTSQVPTFSTNPSNTTHRSPKFSPSKHNPDSGHATPNGEESLREKPKHGSFSSASSSSPPSDESSMSWVFRPTQKESCKRNSRSSSPRPRRGCLWFSPKKKKEKKKSKENWGDEFLPELGSFSLSRKEQQKMLKKAMKEEEKVSREAEKIVQWAKQASARMNVVSHSEGELSDG
ncbi:hypothetical protein Fmac_002785 [Flemingia macrophylla]|uniref:Uncharacterized protein n=1 Tax=Flemingia macrophylla TaxID=520843 RepID=A0ABD1NNS2_9FABA